MQLGRSTKEVCTMTFLKKAAILIAPLAVLVTAFAGGRIP
jgi:hypothetical protein